MKKLISIFLALALTFSLVSCSKTENVGSDSTVNEGPDKTDETETVEETGPVPVHIKEDIYYFSGSTEVDGTYYRPAYLSISRPLLEEKDRDKYPLLAETLDDMAKDVSSKAQDRFSRLLVDSTFLVESGNNYQSAFEDEKLEIMRADSNVVSIATYGSYSYGGAHGDYTMVAENYDTKTGEVIKFTDVVKDVDAFFDQVDVALSNNYRDVYEELRPVKEYIAEIDLDRDLTWWMTGDAVTVYFSYYELAGYYAGGSQTISVSFSENKALFDEKYMEGLEDFIYPADHYSYPGFVDADSNGYFEYINIEPILSEDDYGEINIYLNGREMGLEVGYGDPEIYVSKKSGKYYLYVFCHYENDYVACKVVDLSDWEVLDSAEADGIASEWIEEDTIDSTEESEGYTYNVYGSHTVKHHISDSDSLLLNIRMDLLGTWSAVGEFEVSDDGIPRRKPVDLLRETSSVLKLLKDVNCVSVDEEGNNVATETLNAGTYLMMRRTDGESFVDFWVVDEKFVTEDRSEYYVNFTLSEGFSPDENGKLYRLKIERQDYLHKVEGMPEEELLEGMMYAG